jgi:hypothetical protein
MDGGASNHASSKRPRQDSAPILANSVALPKINELLCYAFKKYIPLRPKMLRQTLLDFYSSDQMGSARDLLMDELEALNPPGWSKPNRRRKDSVGNAGGKIRLDLDDIMNALNLIDENKLWSRLPKFVALDPDSMPSATFTEGDMCCLLGKLRCLMDKLDTVHGFLQDSLISSELQAAKVSSDFSSEFSTCSTSTKECVAKLTAMNDRLDGLTSSWPHMTSDGSSALPLPGGSRPSGPYDLDRDEASSDSEARFNIVSHVHKKNSTSVPKLAAKPSFASILKGFTAPPISSAPPLPPRGRPKRITVIGSGRENPSLRASKNLVIKKAVFMLGNIDASYSTDDITDYVRSLGVGVTSCFLLPRNAHQPDGNNSYRICIFAKDAPSFLKSDCWDVGIVIREWRFHPKAVVGQTISSPTRLPASSLNFGPAVTDNQSRMSPTTHDITTLS